jgi:hypothetical protein
LQDDTIFWNMGGNGLVPYGAPRPPHGGPPDLVDMIQVSRKTGGGSGLPCPGGAPVTAWNGQAAPAILPPPEKPDDNGVRGADTDGKEAEPALAPPVEEKPAPPE